MNTKTLLDSYNSNTLWDMARHAKLSKTSGKKLKKTELLDLMTKEFFQPERITASYQNLTQLEKQVVNRLILHGEQISTKLFRRELLRAKLAQEPPPKEEPKGVSPYGRQQGEVIYGRPANYVGKHANRQSTIFEDIMARLAFFGLIFSEEITIQAGAQTFKMQFHPGSKLIIPHFVRQHLPEPEPLPEGERDWQPAHTMHGDPQLFLRDLYLYWDTVRRNLIPMIKSGLVSKRGLKKLNENLLTPDPTLSKARTEEETGRLFMLRQTLETLRLVQSQDGHLRPKGKKIPKFWQDETAGQVKAVIAAWRKLPTPVHLESILSYYARPDTQTATQYLLTALAEIPTNTWLDAEILLDDLQDRDIDFLITSRSHRARYYYGDTAKLIREMDRLEQLFVTQVIGGFLFQIGLVELGFDSKASDPTTWNAFRLTPLGTAVFQNKPLSAPPTVGQIIIQPNFQILAMGPVPLNLLAKLDLFTERKKIDQSAFEYQLTRESIYTAQQLGFTVAEVEAFLTAVTPHSLPQNIQRSLAEWSAHHERIVFRRGVTLLQAADETLLERLLADTETGKSLARPVGRSVALVKKNRQSQLVTALQQAGILPAVSGASPEAANKSVTVGSDGRIQPIHAVPSLHLHGRLARFTEEAGDSWQLTETAVQRAGGSKKKAQNIIDELHKLHRGRLPKNIVEQVKAWGGYYGAATVGTVTLFEFRDQKTLTELCQHVELKGVLRPFPAGTRALAVVDEASVAAVQTTLAQLGVNVTPFTP